MPDRETELCPLCLGKGYRLCRVAPEDKESIDHLSWRVLKNRVRRKATSLFKGPTLPPFPDQEGLERIRVECSSHRTTDAFFGRLWGLINVIFPHDWQRFWGRESDYCEDEPHWSFRFRFSVEPWAFGGNIVEDFELCVPDLLCEALSFEKEVAWRIYLQSYTTKPVPIVKRFNLGSQNPLNRPYLLQTRTRQRLHAPLRPMSNMRVWDRKGNHVGMADESYGRKDIFFLSKTPCSQDCHVGFRKN